MLGRGPVLTGWLLAVAVLAAPGPCASRRRLAALGPRAHHPTPKPAWNDQLLPAVAGAGLGLLAGTIIGGVAGVVIGCVAAGMGMLSARRMLGSAGAPAADPLRLAGVWDLLAACLRAGLPVATAVRAISELLPAALGAELRRIAHLLALGSDAATTWAGVTAPELTMLARAAGRSATSGAALARLVSAAASEVRSCAADVAEARAQRAGVLITAPLGLCFLPAFICLGVLPVVVGLAGGLLARW